MIRKEKKIIEMSFSQFKELSNILGEKYADTFLYSICVEIIMRVYNSRLTKRKQVFKEAIREHFAEDLTVGMLLGE